jgi:hypothetical protein
VLLSVRFKLLDLLLVLLLKCPAFFLVLQCLLLDLLGQQLELVLELILFVLDIETGLNLTGKFLFLFGDDLVEF